MPKAIVLGNGNILIGEDNFGQVRDFYYPNVGLENQVGGGYIHKIGVMVDKDFSWLDSGDWEIKIKYAQESLVGLIDAFNHKLNLKLEFKDIVYNETDIFIREVSIFNLSDQSKQIKIFFHQEFEIYGAHGGDTAFYDPRNNTIVHYKGRRNFLINAVAEVEGFDDYSIGNFDTFGKEGTYKDAEDGKLSKNPVEHGLVDSVIGFSIPLDGQKSKTIYYWIAAAKTIKEADELNNYILGKTPQHLLKTTEDFWRAWVNKQKFDFSNLNEEIVDLFKKSLLIIRTHVDNKGAIIASCDSDMLQHGKDNYSYMWPRDGALVAISLDKVGENVAAGRFFEFCNEVITDDGYFMHKYRADRSLGSSWHPWVNNGQLELPIQEDETALVLIALLEHFKMSKDLEFIESIYNSLIKKAADFLALYLDDSTFLPKPSYDLWEEKFGIHTFTAASTFGALKAAAEFSDLLGKTDTANKYRTIAESIKKGVVKYLYDQDGYFVKMARGAKDEMEFDKTCDISSPYGIFKFSVLDKNDQMLKKAFEIAEERLTIPTNIGGLARYEGDDYYRVSPDVTGNPWIITTMWLAQYKIALAKNLLELEDTKKYLLWVVRNASSSGILPEQLNPFTGEPISTAPLTWSHAEYVSTVIQYMEKLKELKGNK